MTSTQVSSPTTAQSPNSASARMVTFADVQEAAKRIKPYVHRTPILSSTSLTRMTHHSSIVLKCESLQKTGSFKIRGATNAVAKLIETAQRTEGGSGNSNVVAGFVTHSSGNHGQALAYAARQFQKTAHIVVPNDAPRVKVNAIEAYGGNIVFCRPTLADRVQTCESVLEANPTFSFVHPFDDDNVIAGQGTAGLELMEQTNMTLDAVVVPVGGGGLASGVALAVKSCKPTTAVFAAEPEGADDTYRSFLAGKRVDSHREGLPQTIADGLKTLNSDRTFALLSKYVDGVLRVSEPEISRAMYLVYERCKIVIEPSAAVGIAAVLACPEALAKYKNVGVIICGGNVDISKISSLAKL